ncbi:MAG: DUF6341 family protein [Aquaticitalea sp.]
MKDFFYGIEDLFVNVLFVPFDALRAMQLESWWGANFMSWIFVIVGMAAMVYWMIQLKGYNDNNEEDKSVTSHSYL